MSGLGTKDQASVLLPYMHKRGKTGASVEKTPISTTCRTAPFCYYQK